MRSAAAMTQARYPVASIHLTQRPRSIAASPRDIMGYSVAKRGSLRPSPTLSSLAARYLLIAISVAACLGSRAGHCTLSARAVAPTLMITAWMVAHACAIRHDIAFDNQLGAVNLLAD